MRYRVPKQGLTTADLERANIPRDYWKVRFNRIPETAPYHKEVGLYLRDIDREVDEGHGVYLFHPTNGTGKTGIACLLGKRALLRGFTVYYSMCEAYKSNVVRNIMFDAYQSVYDRARHVDLLILDDFGKEHKGASGWIESELENLIRERVQAGKATLITSNLDPRTIKEVYSVDFSSVLKQGCYILSVPGADAGGKNWRDEIKLGTLRARTVDEEE